MTSEQDTVCNCCGGLMPLQSVWEVRRDSAGECDGGVTRDGRCRAWECSYLWEPLSPAEREAEVRELSRWWGAAAP
jgi:hypothetical protein